MALSGMKSLKRSRTSSNNAIVENNEADSENNNSDTSEQSTHVEGNAGWADSIAKVLNTTKPKAKKTLVLSRAKTLKNDEKPKVAQSYDFEIYGEDGTEQQNQQSKKKKSAKSDLAEKAMKRKNESLEIRIKPTWKDIERERALRKIATRGVVQLFNAVRTQQQQLQQQLKEAGPLDHRKDAVLNNINKKKFLDVLMSGSRAKSEAIDNSVKDEMKSEEETDTDDNDNDLEATATKGSKKNSEWNVLRDDFMTNKKIKHWDENDESNDEQVASSDDSSHEE